ncbi:MAG TPA: hypothetical protein HPQ04_13725 [Rhodospirillaceae bacterium]|nr:hypothetical protein [Rhodospirillaceae bacterium]
MQAIILGARNLVAGPLARRLVAEGCAVTLCGRRRPLEAVDAPWQDFEGDWVVPPGARVFSLLPIWLLPPLIPRLKDAGWLVALSSASAVCYADSPDPEEQTLSARLRHAELQLIGAAAREKLPFTILRPTMIYGGGVDANLSAIVRFADRFGVFPLAGPAAGLRQPIHADDVAAAAVAAPRFAAARDRIFDIGGGEILAFRRLVERVLDAGGRQARLASMPTFLLKALFVLFGRPFRERYSTALFERMNRDQAVNIEPARKAFGFAPRALLPAPEDIPPRQVRRIIPAAVPGRGASARCGG